MILLTISISTKLATNDPAAFSICIGFCETAPSWIRHRSPCSASPHARAAASALLLLLAAVLAPASELELAAGFSRADVGRAGGSDEAEARQPDLLTSPRAPRAAFTTLMCSLARSSGGRAASLEVDATELAEVEAVDLAEVEAERAVEVEVVVELLAVGLRLELVPVRLTGAGTAAEVVGRAVEFSREGAGGRAAFLISRAARSLMRPSMGGLPLDEAEAAGAGARETTRRVLVGAAGGSDMLLIGCD